MFLVTFLALAGFANADPGAILSSKMDIPDVNNTVPVLYMASFYCRLNTTFCITGFYKEDDKTNEDDLLDRLPFYCSNKDPFHVVHHINFTKGDGFFDQLIDQHYEPFLEVIHNCTCDHTARRISHKLPEVKYTGAENQGVAPLKFHEFDVQLQNRGDRRELIQPSKDDFQEDVRLWIIKGDPVETDERKTNKYAADHLRADD